MSRIVLPLLVGLAGVVSVSCGASFPTSPGQSQIAAFQIQYVDPAGEFNVGNQVSFAAYSVDGEGVWTNVTGQTSWYSNDSLVVRASVGSPTVLVVGEGSTTVVGSFAGLTHALPVRVRSASTSYPRYEFTVSSFRPLTVGQATAPSVGRRDSPNSLTSSFLSGVPSTWTSSNPDIASVEMVSGGSDPARVHPHLPGTTFITATFPGNQTYTVGLSVRPRQP